VRDEPLYRLMVLVLQPSAALRLIDDTQVERDERMLAQALRAHVHEALQEGWVLDTVPRPNAEIDLNLEEFADYARAHPVALAEPSPRGGTSPGAGRARGASLSPGSLYDAAPPGRARAARTPSPGKALGGRGAGAGDDAAPLDLEALLSSVAPRPGALATEGSEGGDGEGRVERLTEALVRMTQKAHGKEKLLAEATGKLRRAEDDGERRARSAAKAEAALAEAQAVLAKRSEQCRQLYDIVGGLERRLAEQQQGADGLGWAREDSAVQTDDWVADERAAVVGEELHAERRSRATERTALEAKIQRLELSAAASQNSSNKVHLALFADVRGRLMSELSFSMPDSAALYKMVEDIDRHLGEFGGNE
jgi:hypothetical protein